MNNQTSSPQAITKAAPAAALTLALRILVAAAEAGLPCPVKPVRVPPHPILPKTISRN